MKRITINALVDIGCLITLIPSIVSGLVLYLVLPSGGNRGGGGALFLDITRQEWLLLHNNISLIFFALLIVHLLLHWKFFYHIRRYINPKIGRSEATNLQ